MSDAPWLVIVGLGEDGPDGLSAASRNAIASAEIVMGPPRHLALLGDLDARTVDWPVPFADGIAQLQGFRGRRTVVLASGDPFWFGAGRVIAGTFAHDEWTALPGPSCFSLAAAHLGWGIEGTSCLGLHAAPLARLRPHLTPGAQIIVTLRDGKAVGDLAGYLRDTGFGASALHVFEALGGPNQIVTSGRADTLGGAFGHPVCAAIAVDGAAPVITKASGRDDALFDSDGVMTKRPVRALTLSALAPKARERLWDIGGGSGSIAIEWLWSDPTCQAVTIEPRADRAATIRANAARLGVDRLQVVHGSAPDALAGLPAPDAVFIGGGLSAEMLDHLTATLAPGTRLVANAVTLETDALLIEWHARLGGDLMRVELAQAAPLGPKRGWKAAYPITQWSVTL
ncbi:MAG: precorrin-6Y C5,15-methyltransferase (decarboxylating) subunit CbiT [Marinibacterium sp.]|nr:precorrin-6Y C5,15-methyltransferase (decarboxylating) subunit CbiT [Marinibacterium sp.]